MLVEYVRDKKNQRCGVVVADLDGDNILVGWSKMNKKDMDVWGRFDKARALEIAIGRMNAAQSGRRKAVVQRVPDNVVEVINKMVDRLSDSAEKSGFDVKRMYVRPIDKFLDEQPYVS